MKKLFYFIIIITVLAGSGCFLAKIEIVNIGKLNVSSGKILISDPLYLTEAYDRVLQIDNIPDGSYDCIIQIRYYKNDKRIIKAQLILDEKKKTKSKKSLGKFIVESATGSLIDKETFDNYFIKKGKDRIGEFYGNDNIFFANTIKEEFGWDFIVINEFSSQLADEVTEEQERMIKNFLKYTYDNVNFFIKTNNTYDKIVEEMEKQYKPTYSYADLMLDKKTKSNIIAFSTGFGDGEYEVVGFYDKNQELVKIELDMLEKKKKDSD